MGSWMLDLPIPHRARAAALQAACKLAPSPQQKRALSVRLLALLCELGDGHAAAKVRPATV